MQLSFPFEPDEPDEPELAIEPAVGWRMWRVEQEAVGPVLVSPLQGSPWPAREPARARCVPAMNRHRAPRETCGCGFYASSIPDPLWALVRAPHVGPASVIVGTVSLWGRVIEHEHGFRGELAYPDRIRIVCARCFGTRRVPVPTRIYRSERRLIAACDRHRPNAEPLDLTPADLQLEIMSRYAVDLLPIEALDRFRVRPTLPEPARVVITQARQEARALSRSWLGWLAVVVLILVYLAMRG